MGNITCSVKKLRIISGPDKTSRTNIKIRRSRNPLDLGSPVVIAVVDCGGCESRYKSEINYTSDSFSVDIFREMPYNLKCPKCGNVDTFSYTKTPLRIKNGGREMTGANHIYDLYNTYAYMRVSYRKGVGDIPDYNNI